MYVQHQPRDATQKKREKSKDRRRDLTVATGEITAKTKGKKTALTSRQSCIRCDPPRPEGSLATTARGYICFGPHSTEPQPARTHARTHPREQKNVPALGAARCSVPGCALSRRPKIQQNPVPSHAIPAKTHLHASMNDRPNADSALRTWCWVRRGGVWWCSATHPSVFFIHPSVYFFQPAGQSVHPQ